LDIAGRRVPAIQKSMMIDHTTKAAAGAKIDVSIMKTLPIL
jgi:hypothetical protein